MSHASTLPESQQDDAIITAWINAIISDPNKHVHGRVSQEGQLDKSIVIAAAVRAIMKAQQIMMPKDTHAALIIKLNLMIKQYKYVKFELLVSENSENKKQILAQILATEVMIVLLEDLKNRLQVLKTVIPNPESMLKLDEASAQKVRDVVHAWKEKYVEDPLIPFIFEIDSKLTPLNDIKTMRSVLNDIMVELSSEQIQFLHELPIGGNAEDACNEEIDQITTKLDALALLEAQAAEAQAAEAQAAEAQAAEAQAADDTPPGLFKSVMMRLKPTTHSKPTKPKTIEMMGGSKRRKSKKSMNKMRTKSKKSNKIRRTKSMKIRRIRRTRKSRV